MIEKLKKEFMKFFEEKFHFNGQRFFFGLLALFISWSSNTIFYNVFYTDANRVFFSSWFFLCAMILLSSQAMFFYFDFKEMRDIVLWKEEGNGE